MELTADFSQRVAVHAAQLPWLASPIHWVDRCMLDRPLRARQPLFCGSGSVVR